MTVYTAPVDITTGGFTKWYDTDLWIAAAVRFNPIVSAQAIYAQLRLVGDMGGLVHVAVAAEARLTNISNATFLNAFETSVVVTGGVNDIADTRGLTANFHVEGSPTGTVGQIRLLATQTVAASALRIGRVYGLYVEPQTVGTLSNHSVYAPNGVSLFGTLTVDQPASTIADIQLLSGGVLRWIVRRNTTAETGANAGSDFELIARADDGSNLGTALTVLRATRGVKLGTGPLGFYGTTPVNRPTITGSRGGNAALASLIAGLAATGLITDATK